MNTNWPECPASLKGIQPILKIAQEHDDRDLVVAYWARVYALQIGLKQSTRQENEMHLLVAIMDWLELFKREHTNNDAITNEVVAQAHLENYALKLFLYADKQDRSSTWNKNVVKAFFSSAVIYDVLQTFGELTEEVAHNRKYAKWKASYIHNCLKNGMTPVPGPMANEQAQDENEFGETTTNENSENTGFDEFETPPAHNFVPQPLSPSSPVSPSTPAGAGAAAIIPSPQLPVHNDDNLPSTSHIPVILNKPSAERMMEAQKFCKYAASALNYDDYKAAVENLESALAALKSKD